MSSLIIILVVLFVIWLCMKIFSITLDLIFDLLRAFFKLIWLVIKLIFKYGIWIALAGAIYYFFFA